MPTVFRITPTGIQQGPYSQLIVTPITNLTATSTVAGQITLTWSGGAGYNVQYSYAVSSGTIQSTSGTNPTTITLTSTNQVTTTVTLTETVLGGSTSAVSNSVTTTSPILYPTSGLLVRLVGSSSSIPSTDSQGNTVVGIGGMTNDGVRGWSFPINSSGGAPTAYTYVSAKTLTATFTISAWFRAPVAGNFGDCMSFTRVSPPNTDTNCWYLNTLNQTSTTVNAIMAGWTTNNSFASTNVNSPVNTWFNLLITCDGTNMTYYINGTSCGTGTYGYPGTQTTMNNTSINGYIFIGAYNTNYAYTGNSGLYNSVYAWNRVLNSTEIASVVSYT